MDMMIAFEDQTDAYDRLENVLETHEVVTLQTDDGIQLAVPSEALHVLAQAAHLLARGKAVLVTPQSRARFI